MKNLSTVNIETIRKAISNEIVHSNRLTVNRNRIPNGQKQKSRS